MRVEGSCCIRSEYQDAVFAFGPSPILRVEEWACVLMFCRKTAVEEEEDKKHNGGEDEKRFSETCF